MTTASAAAGHRGSVPAPEDLRLLLGFLNSRPLGGRPDGLGDPQAAACFLARAGLDQGGTVPSETDVAMLRGLRGELVTVLSDAGGAGTERAWQSLQARATLAPVVFTLGAGPEAGLRPVAAGGLGPVVAEVLTGVYRAITTGRWQRLRLCALDSCATAFYDTTRSRTQRWHSYEVCGNRVNVAAYRARARHPGSSRAQ